MDVRDAGGQSERDDEKRKVSSGSDGFGLEVSRIAVAQLCEASGFQSVQGSALHALSDVAVRYMYNVGRAAQFFANLSGRAECNAVDIVQALGDLGLVQGFAGAADIHRCIVRSGVLRDIGYYLSTSEEVPFARHLLNFPVASQRTAFRSFAQCGETPPGGHIPEWLPMLPDCSTHDRSLDESVGLRVPKVGRGEQVGQQMKVARSVLALKKFLAGSKCNVGVSMDEDDFAKERQAVAESNPFLAPPLPFGAKEVSRLDFKDVVAFDKEEKGLCDFAPATDGVNGLLDAMNSEKMTLPCVRPTVHFKLGTAKRSLGSSLPAYGDVSEESDVNLGWNEEKNDKKQRKEISLKKSMEYTREINIMQDPL